MSDDEVQNGMGSDEQEEVEEMSGWADSMSKILKSTKPKNKKTLILSRARKDYEVANNLSKPKSKKDDSFEIAREETSDGKVVKEEKEEEEKTSEVLTIKQQRKLELRQRKLERAWENLNRLTTETTDQQLEIDLMKVATKGVVQLFNAVSQQQKSVKTKLRESSKSEFKKDKVLAQSKTIFDKVMKKNKGAGNDTDDDIEIKEESTSEEEDHISVKKKPKRRAVDESVETSSSKRPMWQALQDDFMLSAKLKDWDKDSDSD